MRVTPERLHEYLPVLRPHPRIVTQGSFGTPYALLNLLDDAIERYRLFVVNAMPGIPAREGVHYETIFIGPAMRGYPRLDYYPCRLSLTHRLFRDQLTPDIIAIQVSRTVDDKVSLGIEVQVLPQAIAAAKERGAIIIAQQNPRLPFTYGDGVLALDDIDLLVEIEAEVPVAPRLDPDAESLAIGSQIAALVGNGACLQAGIGAIPEAALSALANHRGLRVWTELLSDGFYNLHQRGVLDTETPITATFAFGSQELYDWMDLNPQVRLLGCDRTNAPTIIATKPQMTSINTALQVDLFGAANASRIKDRIFSGTGGQTDFIVGALHSIGGQAIIALKSWHPKANVSTIVPKLNEATTSVQFSKVVTEHGTAKIFGAPESEQAEGLIGIADPRAQHELRAAAVQMGLI